jgi:hypothetical protein
MPRLATLAIVAVTALAAAGASGSATIPSVIVFPGTADGSSVTQLFAVSPTGDNLEQLTRGTSSALSPVFSPAGTRIAFTRFGIGIFTMNPDGSGLRRLTTNSRDAYPTWSPDGKSLAFVRPVGPAWKVFVVASKGGKPRQLKQAPAAGRPNWTKQHGLLIPTAADLLQIDAKTGKVAKYFGADLDAIWGLTSVVVSPSFSALTYVGTREPISGDMECGDGPCQRYGLFLENLKAKVKKARMIVKDAGTATFAPDGKRIAFVHAGKLNIRSVATGATTTVPVVGASPVQQDAPAWR